MEPKIVYVEGYFRKDGTWVAPHSREWDGIKNPPPTKRGNAAASQLPGLAAADGPEDSEDNGRGGDGSSPADADSSDEDLDHLVNERGERIARPGVRFPVRTSARGGRAAAAIPNDPIREWRDKSGLVIAVGWLGSRLDDVLWIRTAKGDSVRVDAENLCELDQEFLAKTKR